MVCRCVEEERRGHGCDSIDNDCDQTVDECDEDGWAPEIDIGQAICQCGSTSCGGGPKWYTNEEDPQACVESTTIVEDDCDNDLTSNFTLFDTCFDSYVQIESKDRCNNTAEAKRVGVYIDLEDPVPSCSFSAPDPTSKIVSSVDGSGKILIIDDTGPGVQHQVKLHYYAVDNCGGDMDVKVDIFANEIEDFQSQKMSLLVQTAQDPEEKVDLFVATTVCSTQTNGQCIKDPSRGPTSGEDFRVYTVVVTAFDQSGRSAKEECKVVIVPQTWNVVSDPNLASSIYSYFSHTHDI